MSNVVVLVGNPRPGSRTAAFATALAGRLAAAEPQVIELGEIIGVSLDGEPARAARPQPGAWDAVAGADLVVVATPSYKGTYTGLLKLFLDRYPAGALTGVRAVPVAVAGSPDHAGATAADLLRLLRELGARATSAVAVLESQLADGAALLERHAARLAEEFASA